jgi:hypothetical protein
MGVRWGSFSVYGVKPHLFCAPPTGCPSPTSSPLCQRHGHISLTERRRGVSAELTMRVPVVPAVPLTLAVANSTRSVSRALKRIPKT